jgi:hypothetical protein
MRDYWNGWKPNPINQNPDLHEWDLDLDDLRLRPFMAHRRSEAEGEGRVLIGFVDNCERIYPRERALIVIERLLVFYNSIREADIEEYNDEVEGCEGAKTGRLISLFDTLADNRSKMGETPPRESGD